MLVDDIVVFTNDVSSIAGRFCYDHDIAGRIDAVHDGSCPAISVDVGFGYMIYAQPNELMLAPHRTPCVDSAGKPPSLLAIPNDYE